MKFERALVLAGMVVLMTAAGALAQGRGAAPACATVACEVQGDWVINNIQLFGLAQAMPEDKYGFKPTPAQQTFGERVMHVVGVNVNLLGTLGGKTQPPMINMQATSKVDILTALRQQGEYGSAVLKELSDAQLTERVAGLFFMGPTATRQRIAYFLMTHSQDTYGQLVVYLRLNGLTPPASNRP